MTEAPSLRRAAIILASLGEELAAEACSHLSRAQVRKLGEEVARLGLVSAEELQEALADFSMTDSVTRLGGVQYARNLLDAVYTPYMAEDASVDNEMTVLEQLNDLSPELLYQMLQGEPPQLLAVVISHLTPTTAGQLLGYFPEQTAADIAYRAAHLSALAPGTLSALATALSQQVAAIQAEVENAGGLSLEYVVELMGALPSGRNKGVLEALSALDQDFGDAVAEQVFTFDDLISLSDRDLQVLLRGVEMGHLVLALKGTPEELRERVRSNLSQRGRERLAEEMEVLGPVPLTQVQEAQRLVCTQARVMAERGELSLDNATTDMVE